MKLTKSIKNWFNDNKGIALFVFLTFIVWQIVLAGIIFLGEQYIPTAYQFTYTERGRVINPRWLWNRANFDGVHYLDIARKGYGVYQQAFFPLYPKLIHFLAPYFGGRDLIAGLTISWISLALALFLFYKLVRLDYQESIAKRTLIYLLIFPTAFFFSMVYTESLFLLLVIGSFYFARTKKWWLAGILGALASATRLVGIFLFPALLVEWWSQTSNIKHQTSNKLKSVLPLFLITLGLLFYMWYLKITVGDPLYFIHVQPFFGAQRTGGKIILLYQVFWRYFKMLVTVEKLTPTYFVCVLEFLTGATFLVLTLFAYLRRWFSYVTFMALAYIAPTLTGTLSSVPRYVLVLFPGFILLAIWAEKYRWFKILYPIIAGILLIISTVLFTRGYWVA